MRLFSEYDGEPLKYVRESAMPYRRALLEQAVCAVDLQSSRGLLRECISVDLSAYDVESDFPSKPDVEAWVRMTLSTVTCNQ